MLHCKKVCLICHMQNQVIRNIALKASIGDLIISFHSSRTALASDIFKVGCKSVSYFQFLAADFLDFLFRASVRCTDYCRSPLSSKLESHAEFSKHLWKWCTRPSFHHSYHLMNRSPCQSRYFLLQLEAA